MMIFTTLFIAALAVGLLWFIILRHLRWTWLGYLIVILVAGLFIASGTVHFVYAGVEVAAVGLVLVWWNGSRKEEVGGKPPTT